jgi:hypothetical protein
LQLAKLLLDLWELLWLLTQFAFEWIDSIRLYQVSLISKFLFHPHKQLHVVLRSRFKQSNLLLNWLIGFLDHFEFQAHIVFEFLHDLVMISLIFNFFSLSVNPVLDIWKFLISCLVHLFYFGLEVLIDLCFNQVDVGKLDLVVLECRVDFQ